jgi:rhamnose transport system substrate-binding protein
MDEYNHDNRIDDLTTKLAHGQISRRTWLRLVLQAGAALPTAAALLASTGVRLGRAADGKPLRVFHVPKFTGFFYFDEANRGSAQAAKDLGAEQTYVGTTSADVEEQVQVLQNIIPQHPDCLILAPLDLNAPVPVLRRARQQGASITTYDSDVAAEARDVFANVTSFETLARAILDSALVNSPDGGKTIWGASTPMVATTANEKKAIDRLLKEDAKYKSIQLVEPPLYGDDDQNKSYQLAVDAMQAHPDLRLFISGSGINVPAAAKAIRDTGRTGKIFSTGIANPDTMKTALEDGTCKQYAIWPPHDLGYLATYVAILLKSGKAKPEVGSQFDVGYIGHRAVEEGRVVYLNELLYLTPGHEDFDTALKANL